jgi:hypothetical protein
MVLFVLVSNFFVGGWLLTVGTLSQATSIFISSLFGKSGNQFEGQVHENSTVQL